MDQPQSLSGRTESPAHLDLEEPWRAAGEGVVCLRCDTCSIQIEDYYHASISRIVGCSKFGRCQAKIWDGQCTDESEMLKEGEGCLHRHTGR